MNRAILQRLAVCSWSLHPHTPADLVQYLQAVGIKRVQIALDPVREDPSIWSSLPDVCAQHQITIVSGMFGTVGEDYSTLDSIRRTGGLTPDTTWDRNWRNIQVTADLAQRLGLKLVTFHAGFMPHDERGPDFRKLFDRLARVADLFAARHLELGLETGQETADTLRGLLTKLDRPGVGVNFDPANLILYDKGDPIAALRVVGPWLKQCHIKDARQTRTPGTWGEEVPAGTGQVDWRAFFGTLDELRFSGNLCIEREAGSQRVADIRAARQFVESQF
ncbi:MAG: sugar phosphate isomerase/epimerase [Verrucomicrobia bacterium]|nr:sugar phosphate isomerase/epimerase [Verrucomicrobiota bacterium]